MLDMGAPQSIDSLARSLVEQAGKRVVNRAPREGEIQITYIGLREGEKLHEELSYGKLGPTSIGNIRSSVENLRPDSELISRICDDLLRGEIRCVDDIDWATGRSRLDV